MIPNQNPPVRCVPAGLLVRARAFAFDYMFIFAYLCGVVAVGIVASWSFPGLMRAAFGGPLRGQACGFVIVTLPIALYFLLFEAGPRHATPGKARCELRVVTRDGEELTPGRSALRTTFKLLPWEFSHLCVWQISYRGSSPLIEAGFAMVWIVVIVNVASILVRPTRQSLYDTLSRTMVTHASHATSPDHSNPACRASDDQALVRSTTRYDSRSPRPRRG